MQAVGRIQESMMERFHELQQENENLHQRMGELEEKQETTDGQVYRYSVNAERTLDRVIVMEQGAPAIQQEIQTIRAEAVADRGTLPRIEQLLLRSMGGGGEEHHIPIQGPHSSRGKPRAPRQVGLDSHAHIPTPCRLTRRPWTPIYSLYVSYTLSLSRAKQPSLLVCYRCRT